MFLTDEQVNNRLNSDRNIVRSVSDEIICARNGLKTLPKRTIEKRLTEDERVLIGTIAAVDGPSVASKMFGTSYDETSRLGLGKKSTGEVDNNLREKVNSAVDKELEPVRTKAVSLLTQALDNINPEKLELLSAVKLVALAKGLSGIIKDTNKNSEDTSRYSFNIFNVPKQREIERFETVKLTEVIEAEAVA